MMREVQMRCRTGSVSRGALTRTQQCTQSVSVAGSFSRDWRLWTLKSRRPTVSRGKTYSLTTQPVGLFGSGSKATAAAEFYICIDCGYIYAGVDFAKEPNSYKCPACDAPKRRFKRYRGEDVKGRPNNSNTACLKRLKEKRW